MTYTPPIYRPPAHRPKMTPEERQQIADAYKAGEKIEVICMKFRRARQTVRIVAAQAGLPVRQPGGQKRARNS